MKVLLVGTLPPPGGVDARRFAREVSRRSADGDSVETLSPDPLSVSHWSATLRGRHLARELRARSGEFDAVEMRVEASLGLTARSVGGVIAALGRYHHVTLFMDSPIPFRESEKGVLLRLWSSADTVVCASEADRGSITLAGDAPVLIVVAPESTDMAMASPPWPGPSSSSLHEEVLDAVRARARAAPTRPKGGEGSSMLVTASERVHPSFKGSSIWLAKRVIGKSRGAVTKILRPTPRKAG